MPAPDSYCSACGSTLDGAPFCSQCGAPRGARSHAPESGLIGLAATIGAALILVAGVLLAAYLFVPEFRAATAQLLGGNQGGSPTHYGSSVTLASRTPRPVATPTATPEPSPEATVPPPIPMLKINLGFVGDVDGSITGPQTYAVGNNCDYTPQGNGRDLVTFVQVTTSLGVGGPSIQVLFGDDDGPGPANPGIHVAVNGVSYQWDRDSNLRFEGTEGGTVTYFADGLGMQFDLDMHKSSDALTRVRMIGTIECPPDPSEVFGGG